MRKVPCGRAPLARVASEVARLGPGKFFGELGFFRDRKRQASVRASEHGPVEVLALSYDQLNELLNQSESTNDWLRHIADRNAQRNTELRGVPS